jgi:hypothetical protein
MPILSALNLKLWAYIGTAAIIGLLIIALLATRGALSDAKHERDQATLKLSVSNASIGTLQRSIAKMVAEQKALANSDANRMNAARQRIDFVDAVANVRQAAIDKLNASAKIIRPVDATGQCSVSDSFKGEWQ